MLKFTKQISRTALTVCNRKSNLSVTLILVSLLFTAALHGGEVALFQQKGGSFFLQEGNLYRKTTGEHEKIPLPENTRSVAPREDKLFYVSCAETSTDDTEEDTAEKPLLCVAGLYDLKEKKTTTQVPLKDFSRETVTVKLAVDEGTFYILYGKKDNSALSFLLARVDFNSSQVDYREGVFDFMPHKGKLYFIERAEGRLVLNSGNRHLPLTLEGSLSIAGLNADRFLLVRGSKKQELFDIVTGKNIYTCSAEKGPVAPVSANLLISARDTVGEESDKEDHVFYKVYIDRIEEGRTSTGLASLEKSFEVMVQKTGYHVVKLERWHLDKKRRGYRRANNRYQARPLRLFIPPGRVVRLTVTFDGKKHTIVSDIVME